MFNPEKITGTQRDSALSDLRTLLQEEFPKDTSSEILFAARLADPDFPDNLWEMYHRLIDTIVLEDNPFENNLLSPTPGDPASVFIRGGASYEDEALKYMKSKLDQAASQFEQAYDERGRSMPLITNEIYATILNEIQVQHTSEMAKNDAAFRRLMEKFRNNPNSISLDESGRIERIRGVSATSEDRLTMLSAHPEIDALEDAKITCVLDYYAYIDAKSNYFLRLNESLAESEDHIVVRIDDKDLKPRPRKLDKTISESVIATKSVIAEVFNTRTGQVFEVVEKLNQFAFKTNYKMQGVMPHLVDAKSLEELAVDSYADRRINARNLQPVYMQIVLRVKRDRTDEKEGAMTPEKYDANRAYIIQNGVRVYIEDL